MYEVYDYNKRCAADREGWQKLFQDYGEWVHIANASYPSAEAAKTSGAPRIYGMGWYKAYLDGTLSPESDPR